MLQYFIPNFISFTFYSHNPVHLQEVNLLADIGGQLGLWIGISVLTCCEVLELVLLLIQYLIKRMKAKAGRVEMGK